MASQVEILSSQLGKSVISNAATEATMAELLSAVKKLQKSQSSGSSTNDVADDVVKLNPVLNALSSTVSSFAKSVKGVAAAGTGMFKLVAQGENRMSQYGSMLNQNLVKNLPVVGEIFGSFGELVVTSVSVFEEWNDGLKQTSQYGASFYNSIISFRETANKLRIGTDTLIGIVSKNSEAFVGMGGTVSKGLENTSNAIDQILQYNPEISFEMDRMGYTTDQQAELMMDYVLSFRKGAVGQNDSNVLMTRNFLGYFKQLDLYTKLTGKSKEQLDSDVAVAKQDIAYQLKVQQYNTQAQGNIDQALYAFTSIWGRTAAELFKANELKMPAVSDEAIAFRSVLPSLDKAMKNALEVAKRENMTAEQYSEWLNTEIGKQLEISQKRADLLQSVTDNASAGVSDLKPYADALKDVNTFMLRKENANETWAEYWKRARGKAKKEQETTDQVTLVLRTWERAVTNFKYGLFKQLLPLVKTLSEQFGGDLGGDMRKFVVYLKELGQEAWPHIQFFFQSLTHPIGRERFAKTFTAWVAMIGTAAVDWAFSILDEVLPSAVSSTLKFLGITPDKHQLNAALEIQKKNFREQKAAMLNTTVETTADDLNAPVRIKSGGKDYMIDIRKGTNAFGQYTGYEGTTGFGDTAYTNPQWTDSGADVHKQIQAELKRRADALASGKDGRKLAIPIDPDNPFRWSDMNKLQLDWLQSKYPNATAYKDEGSFNKLSNDQRRLIFSEFLDDKVVLEMNKLKKENPDKYPGLSTGTLGMMGAYFGRFGRGTNVNVHGIEAILTPDQFSKTVGANTKITLRDVLNRLNTNIDVLTNLAKEEILVERSKLHALEMAA